MIHASPFLLLHILYCKWKKTGIKAKKACGKRRYNSNLYGAGFQVLKMTKVRGLALSVARIMIEKSCPSISALAWPVHDEDNERVQVRSLFCYNEGMAHMESINILLSCISGWVLIDNWKLYPAIAIKQ